MIPLVLLPGLMCDARLFRPQTAAFEVDRSVIVPAMTEADTVAGMAVAVLAEAPPRFALAGLSMGGIVAMEILRQAPDRVDRIAFLDTNPLAETPESQTRRARQMAEVRAGRLPEIMRDEMKPSYLADGPDKQSILNLCMAMALDLGEDVFCRQSAALMNRPDQTETLRGAPHPALVLCGREDRLCPVARHEMMADLLTNADLTIVEGAGHLPSLEQPDAVNAALARWLDT